MIMVTKYYKKAALCVYMHDMYEHVCDCLYFWKSKKPCQLYYALRLHVKWQNDFPKAWESTPAIRSITRERDWEEDPSISRLTGCGGRGVQPAHTSAGGRDDWQVGRGLWKQWFHEQWLCVCQVQMEREGVMRAENLWWLRLTWYRLKCWATLVILIGNNWESHSVGARSEQMREWHWM